MEDWDFALLYVIALYLNVLLISRTLKIIEGYDTGFTWKQFASIDNQLEVIVGLTDSINERR